MCLKDCVPFSNVAHCPNRDYTHCCMVLEPQRLTTKGSVFTVIKKIKRRAHKYRMVNQPRYPALFSTLDLTFAAAQTLAVVAVFAVILHSVTQ